MKTAVERFEEKYTPEPMSGCWLWIGSTLLGGYGQFRNNGFILAHRWAYNQFKGLVPAGRVVRHSCDTPCCVNPDHLSVGTHAENSADMVRQGRGNGQKKTHCVNGHEFNEKNTYQDIKRSRRQCRACNSNAFRKEKALR